MAQEESYKRRQSNLVELSTVFGKLHHLRRLCEGRREEQLWRDYMKNVIELEDPASETRLAMINGFNLGFKSAQQGFDRCSRRVEGISADEAARGEEIIAALRAPLSNDLDNFSPDDFSSDIEVN